MPRKPQRKTAQRGYGGPHQKERARWATIIRQRGHITCARRSSAKCTQIIRHGDTWHLDHTDDRQGYLGPSCVPCNTSAGGRKAARRNQLRGLGTTRLRW